MMATNFRDNYGRTPLYLAVQHGHEGVVRTLLDSGRVNFDIRDRNGLAPLCDNDAVWALLEQHSKRIREENKRKRGRRRRNLPYC
jgi:ankyrin repeat protein